MVTRRPSDDRVSRVSARAVHLLRGPRTRQLQGVLARAQDRVEDQIRTPMLALLDDSADEFGPMRMFRPNRDVRFSKDKLPDKLWAGATSESRAVGGTGYYIEVSAAGLVTGYGAMLMARDQLQRFRAALDDDDSGPASEALHGALSRRSPPIACGAQPPLKTGPRDYPPPPSVDVPPVEGCSRRPGIRQGPLDAHPRCSTGSARSGARGTTQGVARQQRRLIRDPPAR